MEAAVNEVNEDSTMANTEKIFISNAGVPSVHYAVIDPSKTCYTTTTRMLREIGLHSLVENATKDDKHSAIHKEDGYTSTVQLLVRSEFMTSWETRSFCVIESDIRVVVLDKPLNPNHLQVPPSNMLPIVNDRSLLSASTASHLEAKRLEAEQENARRRQEFKEEEMKRLQALDDSHKKKT